MRFLCFEALDRLVHVWLSDHSAPAAMSTGDSKARNSWAYGAMFCLYNATIGALAHIAKLPHGLAAWANAQTGRMRSPKLQATRKSC